MEWCVGWEVIASGFQILRGHAHGCIPQAWDAYFHLYEWAGPESMEGAAAAARRHLLLYAQLSRWALEVEPSGTRWRWIPKHHLFQHLMEAVRWQAHPMRVWTYPDEDTIGWAADVAGRCHPAALSRAVMNRYRVSALR